MYHLTCKPWPVRMHCRKHTGRPTKRISRISNGVIREWKSLLWTENGGFQQSIECNWLAGGFGDGSVESLNGTGGLDAIDVVIGLVEYRVGVVIGCDIYGVHCKIRSHEICRRSRKV